MEIKKATPRDFDTVFKLKLESKQEERKYNPELRPVAQVKKMYADYLKNDLNDRWRVVLVARQKGIPVGYVVGKIYRTLKVAGYLRCGYISNLYIKKGFRRKGTARRLLRELAAWFKKKGAVRMTLELYSNNRAAIKLYHKLKFKDYCVKLRKKI